MASLPDFVNVTTAVPYIISLRRSHIFFLGGGQQCNKNIKMQITSDPAGVIHSWAVPSLGVKMDAIPGRLNETYYRIEEPGLYYGQCSELCGPGHGFMPISIKAVSDEEFAAWLEEAKEEFASTKDDKIVLK